MKEHMSLLNVIKNKKSKKGSYIVEAAIFMPILILSITALILIIRIIGICENICFLTAESMMEMDLEAYKPQNTVSLCNETENKVRKENPVNFRLTGFRYLYNSGKITDLISIEGNAQFNVVNVIGIDGKIDFTYRLMTRGFTGTIARGDPLEVADFLSSEPSVTVVVFPRYGKRYHIKKCYYVTQRYKDGYSIEMEQEDAARKGFSPCRICGGAAVV